MSDITLPSGAVLTLGKGVCTHPHRRAPAVAPVQPVIQPVVPGPKAAPTVRVPGQSV